MSKKTQSRALTAAAYGMRQVRHVALNRMPIGLPADCALLYLGKGPHGVAVLLGPVKELNKLPKYFRLRTQAVFDWWAPNGEQPVLVTKDGVVHLVAHPENARVIHKP